MKLLAREGGKSNRKLVDSEAPREHCDTAIPKTAEIQGETITSPSYLCKNSPGEFLAVHWRVGAKGARKKAPVISSLLLQ